MKLKQNLAVQKKPDILPVKNCFFFTTTGRMISTTYVHFVVIQKVQ